MKIIVEDGKEAVQLRKSEVAALESAERICGDLQKWLGNAEAGTAAEKLAGVRAAYCPSAPVEKGSEADGD